MVSRCNGSTLLRVDALASVDHGDSSDTDRVNYADDDDAVRRDAPSPATPTDDVSSVILMLLPIYTFNLAQVICLTAGKCSESNTFFCREMEIWKLWNRRGTEALSSSYLIMTKNACSLGVYGEAACNIQYDGTNRLIRLPVTVVGDRNIVLCPVVDGEPTATEYSAQLPQQCTLHS